MQQRQIELVRESFADVLYDSDHAAAIFYDRLFVLAPETRALFPPDLVDQGRVLIQTLATVVNGLANFDAMIPTIRALAIRHVDYGTEERHYESVRQALFDMRGEFCDFQYDVSTFAAWEAAYALLSATMIAAAREVR